MKKGHIAEKLEQDLHRWRKDLPSHVDGGRNFSPYIDEATKRRIKRVGYW